MSDNVGRLKVVIGDVNLDIEYSYFFHAWDGVSTCDYEIESMMVDVDGTGRYWRVVDWENEMYDPQFAHISTERLEKAISLDIAKNVA